MRDQLTTAVEILGFALIALGAAELFSVWVGVVVVGLELVLIGIMGAVE